MKRLLAAAVLLLLPACVSTPISPETQSWIDTCKLVADRREYSCGTIAPPKVIYQEMREGLYGYYDGGDTVFVNEALNAVDRNRTLIHEMIHYLHVELEMIRVPGPAKEVCWSENEAWTLEGIYSGEDNSKWWYSYPHCYKYYDPDWSGVTLEELLDEMLDDIIEGIEDLYGFETR